METRAMKSFATKSVAVDKVRYDSSIGIPENNYDMPQEGMEGKGVNTQTILYIVIGVCLAAGVTLGIIMGKRAANK